MNKKAIVAALKEALRLAFLGAVGAVVLFLQTRVTGWHADPTVLLVVTGVLKAVDKWVHENESVRANGLVPF